MLVYDSQGGQMLLFNQFEMLTVILSFIALKNR